jgi:hypothetical protein
MCRRIGRIGGPLPNPTSRRDHSDLLQFHFFNQYEIRIELIAERAAASSLSIQAWRWSACGLMFERSPSSVRNRDAADIDRFNASIDHLMLNRYESGANQTNEHLFCEAVSEHQRHGGVPLAPEQL